MDVVIRLRKQIDIYVERIQTLYKDIDLNKNKPEKISECYEMIADIEASIEDIEDDIQYILQNQQFINL